MATLLNWLTGRLAGPVMGGCALLFVLALGVQTARIDGLPLIGGGYRQQVAGLQQQIAARDMAEAKAQVAALTARDAQAKAADAVARNAAVNDQAIQTQIQTVIREVPRAVSSDRNCLVLPWGAVRLLDAAASGADIRDAAARIAPGQPDDAPSTVTLSDAVAVLVTDFGIARQNAEQLMQLQKTVSP